MAAKLDNRMLGQDD